MKFSMYCTIFLGLTAAAAAQELTPREIFLSAPGSPVKLPAKAAVKPPAKPPVTRPAPLPPVEASRHETVPARPAPPRTGNDLDSGAKIVKAATPGGIPLGLRYSLLVSRRDGPFQEIDADSTFHSGDALKITVESNDDAYLYIVARDPGGTWEVLYPRPQDGKGDNHVPAYKAITVPGNPDLFRFDSQAGEEKVFIMLSRQPEASLDDLMYKVSGPKPGAAPAPRQRPEREMLAQLARPIDDQLVGRVRANLVSRGLRFEKVDATQPIGTRKETAAYVVSTDTGADAKVVADLVLKHQ